MSSWGVSWGQSWGQSWGGVGLASSPTGGWGFLDVYDHYKAQKDQRDKEEKQLRDEIKKLNAVDEEIAQLLHQDEFKSRQDMELARLEQLVAKTFSNGQLAAAKAYNEKVAKAYVRAAQQGNYSAYKALERELAQAREEEDFLALALVMLD